MCYLQICTLILQKAFWVWMELLGCDRVMKWNDRFSNVDATNLGVDNPKKKKTLLGVLRGSVPFCHQLNIWGFAPFISWTSNLSLCFKLQAYTHTHFGMQSMLVVYTVLPVCLGPIALLHHPIWCKRDTTGRGGDGLGGKRWGSSLVPWLISNEMQIHSLCVCWVPLPFFFFSVASLFLL